MYEVVEHTADLGLRVRANDLNTLFAEAGKALFSVIVADLEAVVPREEVTFRLEGQTYDYLLFDWLSELGYTFDARRLVLSEFVVHVGLRGLEATARGEPLDPKRHGLGHEVKAITYHGLKVEHQAEGWLAEVLLDI